MDEADCIRKTVAMIVTDERSPHQDSTEHIHFLIDPGAHCHLVNELHILTDPKRVSDFEIHCANWNALIFATHHGHSFLQAKKKKYWLIWEEFFFIKELIV